MEISKKSQKIKKVRETLGLSVTAFAARCGYTNTSFLRVEQSERDISSEVCEKICAVYGVNPNWLMNDNCDDDSQMFTDGKSYGRRLVPADEADPKAQGERVRLVYEESGLPQREFCEKIGSSTSNLQSIMQGKRKLTIRYAEKMEKALGVGVDWLLFGTEEAKDYPCGDEMILFLKRNPEIRKMVWEKMKENGGWN